MHLRKQTIGPDDIAHRLSTNTLSSSKRIQRWGNFIAGFSIEFVEQCLSGLNPKLEQKQDLVLDPFAGCATTLLGAKNLGFASVGYEPHPVFHAISSGKLRHHKGDDIEVVLAVLQKENAPILWSSDSQKFLSKMFTDDNLALIAIASANLHDMPTELRDLSVTLFLKACELTCGSQTDGIYKAPTTKKTICPSD